jgi:hypothetical protein
LFVPKEAKCDFPSASVLGFGEVAQPANTSSAVATHEKQIILIMPKIPFPVVINGGMLRGWGRGGNGSVMRLWRDCQGAKRN